MEKKDLGYSSKNFEMGSLENSFKGGIPKGKITMWFGKPISNSFMGNKELIEVKK